MRIHSLDWGEMRRTLSSRIESISFIDIKTQIYIALAYFITGYLGLRLSIFGDMVTLIWLPSGIAVAAIFHFGALYCIGVFVGAFLATYSTNGNLLLASCVAFGNTLAPLVSAKLLRHYHFDSQVHSIRDLLNFVVLGALVPMTLSATNGSVALVISEHVGYSDFFHVWSHWWIGDVVGVLLCGFALITLKKSDWFDPLSGHVSPAFLRVLAFTLIYLVFWINYSSTSILEVFTLTFPLVLLINLSFRFGISVTALAALVFGLAGSFCLAFGLGPFVSTSLNISIAKFWAYIGAITLVSEIVSILNTERTITIGKLQKSEARFKSLTNLSADWYWEMDTDFRITRIDGNLSEAVLDMSFEKIGETRWRRSSVIPTRDEWILHRSALESHLPFYELEIKRIDRLNDPVWISISGVPVFNDQGDFSGYRGVGKDISSRKTIEESLWRIAHHDRLTDLPNRRLFQVELERSLEIAANKGTKAAVLLMDLDDFKSINDSLGHQQGDELLIQVSNRLSAICHLRFKLFRMGGDEFTILVEGEITKDFLESIASEVLTEVSETYSLKTEIAHLTVSVGIAIYPDDRTDAVGLMSVVDQAMYRAKKSGKSCYFFFSEELDLLVKRNQWLVRELHAAIKENQFSVVYQPIVDLNSGIVCKAEALIRWNHPIVGAISPAEFIPLAESSGLIIQIGDWVFDEAVNAAQRIRSKCLSDFQISVNKSPVQIANADPKRSGWVTRLLEIGVQPDCVIVEITEGVLLQTNAVVKQKLDTFKSVGMQVALDDFGTGYSSLSYLQQHDIDYVKIDRAFIMNLERNHKSKVLCEAVIAMAHKLNIKVVAEGVETVEQMRLLLDMKCDFAQGYYFSRPLAFDALRDFLSRQNEFDLSVVI
jgi:diguanylate cyclase (GGDEF)-like protein